MTLTGTLDADAQRAIAQRDQLIAAAQQQAKSQETLATQIQLALAGAFGDVDVNVEFEA